MKDLPIFSICIPTYNRSQYLKQTLNSIVDSDGFCDEVEVVISDNCSTDDTSVVCKEFTEKYKNIKYFRQPKPTYIADQNFIDVLSLANGKYIKLSNDTVVLRKGALLKIIQIIKNNIDSNIPLFFYQNYRQNQNILMEGYSVNDIIKQNSYFITWITNFGCWKKDFDNLIDKDKYISFGLMQVDWTYRIITSCKKYKVYFYDLYDLLKLKKKSGVYNIFKVFGYNYFYILKEYLNKNILSKEVFELEKKRILFRFLMPTYVMTIYKKNFLFDTSKMFKYLTDYKKNWYFYMAICLLPIYFVVYGLIFLIKTTTSSNDRLYQSLRRIKARLGI
jgi:glycosyltransferase involved in cell wall biosynthesis